jgi:3-oxoacyl-[acyl-carrier protein] reductase
MKRVAVVTGASRGLGAALAGRLWDIGYSLVLVARGGPQLARVAASLPSAGGQACDFVPCDLSDPSAVESLVAGLVRRHERLDVLVNNAAVHGPIGPAWETDPAAWHSAIQVNLLAPVALCRAAIPLMRDAGGCIVNISGGGATAPRPRFAAYAASKAALVRFSETLAEETRDAGIRVNCVAPGPMQTHLLDEILRNPQASGDAEVAKALGLGPGAEGAIERVCRLVLFLASEAGRGITGKLVSAVWDRWEDWPAHAAELATSDVYTLRRIVGRDRGMSWGDA